MKPHSERVQKYLANLGIGSRRQIESWISEGKVRVNGRTAQLGDRVSAHCNININGRPLNLKHAATKQRVLIYNKPEGEICSRDEPIKHSKTKQVKAKRISVFQKLPKVKGQRWVSVGRLDLNTRGLLLFTTDGQLAHRLMHPSGGLEREYLCRVFGDVTADNLDNLRGGVRIDGHIVAFNQIRKKQGEGSNTWYSVVITQGRNREVRKLWQSVQCRVSRLIRVRYGPITLPRELRQGQYMELKPAEIEQLVGRLQNTKTN